MQRADDYSRQTNSDRLLVRVDQARSDWGVSQRRRMKGTAAIEHDIRCGIR
jgi:hypothetical protein